MFVFYNSKFIRSLFIQFTFYTFIFYTFVFYMVRFLNGSLFIIQIFSFKKPFKNFFALIIFYTLLFHHLTHAAHYLTHAAHYLTQEGQDTQMTQPNLPHNKHNPNHELWNTCGPVSSMVIFLIQLYIEDLLMTAYVRYSQIGLCLSLGG